MQPPLPPLREQCAFCVSHTALRFPRPCASLSPVQWDQIRPVSPLLKPPRPPFQLTVISIITLLAVFFLTPSQLLQISDLHSLPVSLTNGHPVARRTSSLNRRRAQVAEERTQL